jgi:hypothetical protein
VIGQAISARWAPRSAVEGLVARSVGAALGGRISARWTSRSIIATAVTSSPKTSPQAVGRPGGRRCAGVPVIHPATRGGPWCLALLGGSIRTVGRPLVVMEAMTVGDLARGSASRRRRRRRSGARRNSCGGRRKYFRTRSAAARQATDFSVAQAVEGECEDLARDCDLGDLQAAALGDPFEAVAERSAAAACVLGCLDPGPEQRPRSQPTTATPLAPVARRPAPATPPTTPLTANQREQPTHRTPIGGSRRSHPRTSQSANWRGCCTRGPSGSDSQRLSGYLRPNFPEGGLLSVVRRSPRVQWLVEPQLRPQASQRGGWCWCGRSGSHRGALVRTR